jgi:hypothetical protein
MFCWSKIDGGTSEAQAEDAAALLLPASGGSRHQEPWVVLAKGSYGHSECLICRSEACHPGVSQRGAAESGISR